MGKERDRRDFTQIAFDVANRTTHAFDTPRASKAKAKAKKGGEARKEALTPEERSEIARKAARARWHGKPT